MNVMAGDRIRDPSGKLFVVVDVAGGVAIVSRTQVLHSLDGWEVVQRVSETGEVASANWRKSLRCRET